MRKVYFFLAMLFVVSGVSAQTLYDSYTDGDFTTNPVWGGNTSSWTIVANSDAAAGATGSNTLRLAAPAVSQTDYLSSQVSSWGTSQEWGFFIGRRAQAFTAANQAYFWLYANESTLTSATVDGYRIAIGDDAGGDDIRLEYIVNGAVSTTVIASAGSFNNGLTDIGLLIRVTRSATGAWEVFTSAIPTANGTGAIATGIPDATNAPTSRGTGTENSLPPAANGYIGVAALHSTGASAIISTEFDQIYFTPTTSGSPSLSGSALASFNNVCINTTAGPNSFTITGSNLTTAVVTVASLSGYTFSTTSGGSYTPSLTLSQPGGSYSQQVFVDFTPTAVQSYNGNIIVGGGGAPDANVAAVGAGVNTSPSVTAGTTTGINPTGATIHGKITVIGCSAISGYGVEYSITTGFTPGTGTQVAGSNLAADSTFTVPLSGLGTGVTYYFRTYATNGGGTSYSTPEKNFTTLAPEPTNHATSFACGVTTPQTIPLTWTDATGGTVPSGYLIKWSNVSYAAIVDPVDGTAEANTPGNVGSLNVAAGVQAGTATGLAFSTAYYFKIYPYTNSGSLIDYKIDGTVPQTTCTTQAGPIAAWDFTGPGNVATVAGLFDANLVSASGANNITRGPGAAASAGANSFRTVGFQNDGIATTNTDYFQITLTAQPGFDLSLSTIDANLIGTATYAATPGVSSQFAYSIDGINFTLIGSPSVTIGQPVTLPTINVAGVSALQNVPAGTTITLRYYASGQTNTGGWGFASSASGVNGLAIGGTVTASSSPNLAVSSGSLSFSSQAVGTNSPSQNINLSGVNLTGFPDNITVTAPSTDFQVSNDNSTWGASTTIPYTSAALTATPVYIRFTPQSAGPKSGNVTFSGGGDATPPTVAVSGSGTITYYSKSSGNLTDVATWGTATDGTGTSPSNFSIAGQAFTVANRTTVTLDADWTISGTGSKVITGDGTSATELIVPSTAVLTGTTDVANLGKLTLQNSTLPTFGVLATGSTVNYAQAGTFVIPTRTYYNLTLTGGTKTLATSTASNFIVSGNLLVDGVTGFNGAATPFTTVNLAGNFTLMNGATFEPVVTGDGNRLTLILTGSGTQTISGGDFYLFRLQTPSTPATTLNVVLSSANLLLGNASSGGLNLQQATHTLSLSGNTVTIRGSGFFSSTNTGTLIGSSTSNLVINKSTGGGNIGSVGFATGTGQLNNLNYNSAGTGSNNLTINSPVSVAGTLTLTNGNIITTSTNLLTLLSTGSLSGGSSASFISGPFARETNAATAVTFPVGKTANYKPFDIIPVSANVSTYSVEYFGAGTNTTSPACTPARLQAYTNNEYWDVQRTAGTADAQVRLNYSQAISNGNWTDGTTTVANPDASKAITVAHYTGTCWQDENLGTGILAGDATSGQVTSRAISTFSPITFGYGSLIILPVNFDNVKATQQSTNIKVEWSNMTELDVVNYSIERSADGRNFVSVGTANARLNNGSKADYSFIDVNPFNGVNYYRIRSLESSGKNKYSIIVKVDIRGGATQLVLYPNPVSDGQLSYQANNLVKGQYTIRVFNNIGQQVYSKTLNHQGGSISEAITLPTLRAGVYSLQLSSDDNNFVKTFVVQ